MRCPLRLARLNQDLDSDSCLLVQGHGPEGASGCYQPGQSRTPYRFHDVRYRPEAVTWTSLRTLFRLAKMYWRQGWAASRFFSSMLGKTFWPSPRSLPQMINLLGMYQHFCKLLSQDVAWNPWAPATPEPIIHSSRVCVSDVLSRVGHDEGAVDGKAKFVPHANCPRGPSPGTAPQTLSAASRAA